MIEAPEPPHHHGHSQSWFDRIIAIAVVSSAIGSLYVSLHTGHTMEALVEQNARLVRANSTPFLTWNNGNLGADGKPRIMFRIYNNGTGPARLVWIELAWKGKAFRDPYDYLKAMGAPVTGNLGAITSNIANTLLRPGDETDFFQWPVPQDAQRAAAWSRLETERKNLVATACYCSIFNECWTSHLDARLPTPVKDCDPAGHASFLS